jgi:hypothetical protein
VSHSNSRWRSDLHSQSPQAQKGVPIPSRWDGVVHQGYNCVAEATEECPALSESSGPERRTDDFIPGGMESSSKAINCVAEATEECPALSEPSGLERPTDDSIPGEMESSSKAINCVEKTAWSVTPGGMTPPLSRGQPVPG